VTIFGESAGGVPISLHLLSPAARNLFQNAIIMSGAALNHHLFSEACAAKKFWLKAAKLVGCTDEDGKHDSISSNIMKCMRQTDAERINQIVHMDQLVPHNTVWLPLPVIDGQYMTDKPIEQIEKGNYKTDANVLIGTTSDEGSFVLHWIVDPLKYDKHNPHNLTRNQAFDELKRIATFYGCLSETDAENVAKTYFLNISPQSDDYDLIRRTIGVAFGDYMIGCPTILFAKSLFGNSRQTGRVYQYFYDSKLGDPHKLICSEWMGSCHTNDLWPLFGIPFQQFDRHLDVERDESLQVIHFFSHFAKYGSVVLVILTIIKS
jgi:carboxylesterase 1